MCFALRSESAVRNTDLHAACFVLFLRFRSALRSGDDRQPVSTFRNPLDIELSLVVCSSNLIAALHNARVLSGAMQFYECVRNGLMIVIHDSSADGDSLPRKVCGLRIFGACVEKHAKKAHGGDQWFHAAVFFLRYPSLSSRPSQLSCEANQLASGGTCFSGSYRCRLNHSSAKSSHVGFVRSIRKTFFSRFHRFNCFSRSIAFRTS